MGARPVQADDRRPGAAPHRQPRAAPPAVHVAEGDAEVWEAQACAIAPLVMCCVLSTASLHHAYRRYNQADLPEAPPTSPRKNRRALVAIGGSARSSATVHPEHCWKCRQSSNCALPFVLCSCQTSALGCGALCSKRAVRCVRAVVADEMWCVWWRLEL